MHLWSCWHFQIFPGRTLTAHRFKGRGMSMVRFAVETSEGEAATRPTTRVGGKSEQWEGIMDFSHSSRGGVVTRSDGELLPPFLPYKSHPAYTYREYSRIIKRLIGISANGCLPLRPVMLNFDHSLLLPSFLIIFRTVSLSLCPPAVLSPII